jgi:cell wall-associated NlpC family hydrolase
VAAAVVVLTATSAGADPHDTAAGVTARVDRLHEQAERAAERFHAADERYDRLRDSSERILDRVARGQQRLNGMRNGLAALAGVQYRSGGLDPALALFLSEDPGGYLDKASLLDRIGSRQAGRLLALRTARRDLEQERQEAVTVLGELEHTRAEAVRTKRQAVRRLAAARRLLGTLTDAQREAYAGAPHGGGHEAEASASGGPPAPGASSARAAAAVAAARRAVGVPYVWGMAGPRGFDCSGLVQWSYAQAGVALPRTSQAQRFAGWRVPLGRARPGDLVTYRSDASHVGMYVGNGQVVHAPHPGARVRYDPLDMMPGAYVTRV